MNPSQNHPGSPRCCYGDSLEVGVALDRQAEAVAGLQHLCLQGERTAVSAAPEDAVAPAFLAVHR